MKIWKYVFLYYLGGGAYLTLEFLFRGRSHGSMFLLGGLCFLILGKLRKLPCSILPRAALGAGIITVLELLTGLLVNRDYSVWDYRHHLLNFRGQICPLFTLLWIPVSIMGFFLYDRADRALTFRVKSLKM